MTPNILAKPTAFVLVVISIAARLLPHPPNMTPVGATALFGGAKLSRPWNYLVPLFILFVTDIFIGFHGTMIYVYSSFLITVFLGDVFLRKNPRTLTVAGVSLTGSLIFYLVSNFGVWREGIMYPHSWTGLIECYVAAIPFLRNTLLGDLVFGVGFFALYQWAERKSLVGSIDSRITTWVTNKN